MIVPVLLLFLVSLLLLLLLLVVVLLLLVVLKVLIILGSDIQGRFRIAGGLLWLPRCCFRCCGRRKKPSSRKCLQARVRRVAVLGFRGLGFRGLGFRGFRVRV